MRAVFGEGRAHPTFRVACMRCLATPQGAARGSTVVLEACPREPGLACRARGSAVLGWRVASDADAGGRLLRGQPEMRSMPHLRGCQGQRCGAGPGHIQALATLAATSVLGCCFGTDTRRVLSSPAVLAGVARIWGADAQGRCHASRTRRT